MGHYVFTVITCPISAYNRELEIGPVAGKHLSRLTEKGEDGLEVREEAISLHFLSAISQGRCINSSSKGEGLAYAATGNGTNLDGLVNDLIPIFEELWELELLLDFEHVIIMTNAEQTCRTDIAEIVHETHMNDSDCLSKEGVGKRVRLYREN